MADQQFLVSFGVDIDEGGVARLQQILSENRTLAQSLADSFSAASESIKAFKEEISTDLPSLFSGTGYGNVTENHFGQYGGLKIGLDMTEPKKEIASFTADAKKPIGLSANASGIVSAARTALESVRSLFSETFILNVRANTSSDSGSDGSSSRNESRNDTGSSFLRMSSGGRFTRPTSVEVAEDGDAEYIIPVKKENKALPLLRQLLSELSPEARQSLTDEKKPEEAEAGEIPAGSRMPFLATEPEDLPDKGIPAVRNSLAEGNRSLSPVSIMRKEPLLSVSNAPKENLSDLLAQLSSALQPAGASVANTSNNLSAPVTINVNATGSDAERIGQSIYDTAERYLLRTMRGVFA